jgi:hypothetical protein
MSELNETVGAVPGLTLRPINLLQDRCLIQTSSKLTLLVNAQQAISNAMGVRGTRGIVSVALASNRRVYARFAARFCINQQSQSFRYLFGLISRPYRIIVTL